MPDIGHVLSRVRTDLTGLVSSTDTDFPVLSTAGFVVPCAILVGHKNAWHDPTVTYAPELVWITEVVDGTTLRCALSDRGISGTSVRSHDGTTGDLTVTAVLDQRHWQRLRDELAGLDERYLPVGIDRVNTVESDTRTTYGNITGGTVGPTVSLTLTATGRLMVEVAAEMSNSNDAATTRMSFVVTRQSDSSVVAAAADANSIRVGGDRSQSASRRFLLTGLPAEPLHVQAKYRVSSWEGTWGIRTLTVEHA